MPNALESTSLGILYFTMGLTAAAAAVRVYENVFTERCAPSALLLVVWPRRDAPFADRRVGREATSLYSCVTTQLTDRFSAAACYRR